MSDTTATPKPSDIAKYLAQKDGIALDPAPAPETPAPAPAPATMPVAPAAETRKPEETWKAPWNDGDNPFDAERAKRMIANLKAETQRLRGERDAAMNVQQTDRVTQLEAEVKELRTQLQNAGRATALVEANLPAELAPLITATTPEGVQEQIKLLTSLRGEAVPAPAPNGLPGFTDPVQTSAPTQGDSLGAKLLHHFGA